MVGETCDEEKKGSSLFLLFHKSNHELTGGMSIFFMLQPKSKEWKSEIGRL